MFGYIAQNLQCCGKARNGLPDTSLSHTGCCSGLLRFVIKHRDLLITSLFSFLQSCVHFHISANCNKVTHLLSSHNKLSIFFTSHAFWICIIFLFFFKLLIGLSGRIVLKHHTVLKEALLVLWVGIIHILHRPFLIMQCIHYLLAYVHLLVW